MRIIPITQNQEAIVDDSTFDMLSQYHWYASKDTTRKIRKIYYAATTVRVGDKWKNVLMHHVVFGHPLNGKHVDHINGNTLDNRRENLQLLSVAQNLQKARKSIKNKSGYKGVSLDRATGKWSAFLCRNYKNKFLGLFESAEEAAKAYDVAVEIASGSEAITNKKLGLLS